jgi:hypothetical protein
MVLSGDIILEEYNERCNKFIFTTDNTCHRLHIFEQRPDAEQSFELLPDGMSQRV